MIKLLKIVIIALIIILAITLLKYKPIYKVTISGEEIGYVTSKSEFEKIIESKVLNPNEANIAYVDMEATPEYEFVFVSSDEETNEQEVFSKVQELATVTYKIYAITINNEDTTYVNSREEAEETVAQLKETYESKLDEIEIGMQEIYTQDLQYATTVELASAIETTGTQLTELVKEQEKINAATLNGVYFSVKPVTGTITSRFGLRTATEIVSGDHKGIDIGAPRGTSIYAAADGKVTYSGWMGGYGNLVIISHGNGIETYYGHCSSLYVSAGSTVKAGDSIAAVGSTGNSTGNHLHFEIRKNGGQINPQTYVYK